jgi:PAS domain S-box-containing protein
MFLFHQHGHSPYKQYLRAGGITIRENNLRVIAEIFVCLMIIFAADISTPLGLSVWILYFIPLFLTLYVAIRNGPFYVTGTIIVLTTASFFISPQDVSPLYATLNRLFFSCMLIASAFLIWNYKEREESLRSSEKNYRILTEWSPDAVLVYRNGAIRYANQAFLRLLGGDPAGPPVGRDILDMIQPDKKEIVRERIRQASLGAQGVVADVHLMQPDGKSIRLDMAFREVCWDGSFGVLILARIGGRA